MKNLNLTNVNGFFVSFDLADIKFIKYGKAREFYSKQDLDSNCIGLSEAVIMIYFKDGNTASFANDWVVTFG